VQVPAPSQVFCASQAPLGAPPQVVPAAALLQPYRLVADWHTWQGFCGLRIPFA